MKKSFFTLLFTAAMTVAATHAAESVPYEYTFTDMSLGDWTQVNNDGQYPYWQGHTTGAAIAIEMGISNDDYLVSPELEMQAGKTYQVAVAIHNLAYTMDAATMNVVYGTGNDVTSYADAGEITLKEGTTPSVQLTVPNDGNYKIALHCTTTGVYDFGSGQIFISSVSVTDAEEGGSGDEPQSVAVPYEYTFSSTTFDDGWSQFNANGDAYTWSATTNYVYSYLGYYGYGTESNDDYLFSPLFSLEAGTNYVITVNMPGNNPYMNEQTNVDVMYGTSDDGSGYTSIGKLEINPGGSSSISFSVSQTGNYKIAFHDISAPEMYNMSGIYLTSFSIAPGEGGGDEPQEGVAVPYDYSFSSTTFDDGWSKQNANGDGYEWSASSAYVYSYIAYSTNDDYLFSPAFALEAEKTYSVTVAMNDYTTNNGETIVDVMYGTGNDGASYTSIGKLDINPGGTSTVTFSVPQNGNYQIAFHDASSSSRTSSIYLTSFSIAPDEGGGDTPVEITELPYSYDFSTSSIGDWSTLDANSDGITWHSSTYGTNFGICCREGSTGLGEDNDYLVSPETFSLEAGKTYTATLSVGGFPTVGDTNLIELVYGSGDDFTTYASAGAFTLDQDVAKAGTTTLNFSVKETGLYRIGLHNASVQAVWYLTKFDLSEYAAPELPEGVLLDKDFNDGVDLGWTILDENADENPWQFIDGLNGISLSSKRGAQGNHNDWLISPAMEFEAGKSYLVSFTISASGNADPATVLAAYGSAATSDAMTNVIDTRSIGYNETDTAYYRITPTAAGSYYLGFLANSSANNGTVSVLSVKVEESAGITPLAPAGLAAEPNIQAGEVKLSWTNPAMDTENIALDGNITLRITRNGETVEDVTGQPGEAMSYIDRPTPFEGEATYQVAAFVSEDKLGAAAETVANLNDFQGERSELYSWGGTYGGGFNDWTVINNNGGNTWTASLYNDTWYINYGKPSDDWLISPEVTLTTNRRYVIEVEVKSGINYPAELNLYTGQGASIANMTNFVCSITAEGNGSKTYTSEQFTVDADGKYNLGVRAVNISTRTDLLKYTIYYYENNDTKPKEVPYTEDFTDTDLAGWNFADGSTFAVADGALTSSQNGAPRSEIAYSPLINLKGGYTYEVTFDYAFDGADDGSTFTFYMADGQSESELIADSRLVLDGTTDGRCLFTAAEDGSYCLAWQIIAGADDDVKASVDNIAVGVNIYSGLPYSEDFEDLAINETPTGYTGITAISDDGGNIAAEVQSAGGSTIWFNQELFKETYSVKFKYRKSDSSAWTINTANANGDKQLVASLEGGASTEWTEATFAIPAFDSEEPYGFRLEFSTSGEGTLQLDDIAITKNNRAMTAAAPKEFRVYKNALTGEDLPDLVAWNYPTTESDGNKLDSNTQVTVTFYEDNKPIGSATGTPGSADLLYFKIDDNWTNGVKLYRAVASIDGVQGEAATWAIMENDNSIYGFGGNTLSHVKFDFSSDENWDNNGWNIADGIASAAPGQGTATITSPEFELTEGQIYLVRYYIDTDADSPADFTVSVGDAQQVFTEAYIGRNTYSWNVFDPENPYYCIGDYLYIDFMLPRIEKTGNYDVTISASNIGKNISVESVEVLEVREYPTVCEVPYENDFEDLAAPSGSIEPNWTIPFYTEFWRIDDMSAYDATAASGNRALVAPPTNELASTNPQDFIYTPYFAVKAGKTYRVEFEYYMPSAQTGLAFIYANAPTSTEGEYATIDELAQATGWTSVSTEFKNTGVDGTLVFGFVSYAAEVRDQVTAIDNFKIYEVQSGSVSEIEAGAKVTYANGMLNIPADIENVAIYDIQGRMVMSICESGTTVSLDNLSDGVYVVKATDAGGSAQTLKIVK